MRTILRYLCGLILCGLTCLSLAAEVDQFSGQPFTPLNDSSAIIEAEVERRIDAAIKLANSPYPRQRPQKVHMMRRRPNCDVERLYDSLRWYLARPVIGQVETFAEQSDQVERRRIPFEQSIYRDFAWQYSPSLVLSQRIAAVIRLGGTEVGTDKLGHFFTEGASYFAATQRLQGELNAGLLFGEWSESLYFGAQTTGVFSYADLVANFQGLRFWNRILAEQPDPLYGTQPEAYIRCENKRWQRANDFLWADYVDDGWNESINCSVLRTPALLQQLSLEDVRCSPKRLPKQRYGELAERLLNPQGLAVLAQHLQPEALLPQRIHLRSWALPPEAFEHIKDMRERLELWRQQQVGEGQ
ncbi:hypothetical protein [Bacterioplanes sanyensis]|uniref:hypothetical protein n=1 Tax=Bacterioplanes sanyensis TaxID=1249553 RepID=UPI0012FDF295|nr:hypothetical protein [Bacterioplanes sanyensis]